MMHFKRHLLAVTALAGISQLSACGGSSDDREKSIQPAQTVAQRLSNKAAGIDPRKNFNLTRVKGLTEIIDGKTEDLGNPSIPLVKGHRLIAPAGQTDFVSRLTSLLDAEVNRSSLPIEEAKSNLERWLGINGGAVLTDRYHSKLAGTAIT